MNATLESTTSGVAVATNRTSKLRAALIFAAIGVLFSATTALMVLIAVFTLGRSRRFCSEVLGGWLGRTALRVCGIQMETHGERPSTESQKIYLTNHTSTIDVFVLLALSLPRTRFFLWGGLRKFPPIAIMGYLTGIFFTPTQSRPDKRARCFQHAEKVLRDTGDSALLSPEGMCVTVGGIGRFNKGAFHLATNLGVPLIPLFISIPRHIDPGRGYGAQSGVVHVYFNEPICTSDWKLDDLHENKEAVRDRYVEWNRRLRLP